jgi:outer membrane protein OmpA-like peptidoglycan-associated protein
MKKGIMLSTGDIRDASGSNTATNTGQDNFQEGFSLLNDLIDAETGDAAVLEIGFIPSSDSIAFTYLFASEEYPEFINRGLNDVFGMFLFGPGLPDEGINLAVLPESGLAVCVNHINHQRNQRYYVDNPPVPESSILDDRRSLDQMKPSDFFRMDGYTVPLIAGTAVIPGMEYRLVIAIADAGDRRYDSVVLLQANSFVSVRPPTELDVQEMQTFTTRFSTLRPDLSFNRDSSVVSLDLRIQFEVNSAELKVKYLPVMEGIYALMKEKSGVSLLVIGHTDNSGDKETNYRLSGERAEAVARQLISLGLDASRIDYTGRADEEPVASNQTPEGRSMNRRVEFVFQQIPSNL